MNRKVFNEIYDQLTPDAAVMNELFEKLETAKPKAIPFKPIMAVMGAAAVIALSFGVTKLIPDDPIDVAFNPSLTTTSPQPEESIPAASVTTTTALLTTSNDILTSESETELSQETTTTPVKTEETTSELTTSSSITTAPCYGPGVTSTTAVTTTTTTPVVTTTTTPVVTTTTTTATDEITTTTTTTTIVTTLPPESESTEEEVTEEDVTEEDEEVAEEDVEYEELPKFNTFSEYITFLSLGNKAYIGYEEYFRIGESTFVSFTSKEIDISIAETILNLTAGAKLNPDAPRKDGDSSFKYHRLSVDEHFTVDFYENGTVWLSASNYTGIALFSADTAAYEKLDAYIQALKNKNGDINIPISDETEVDAEEVGEEPESMPEEDESEEAAVTESE